MSSSMYKKYWPFRSRSRAAAPRGRLEEESDVSVRGGVNKKKLRETSAEVTEEARAADAGARPDVQTPASRNRLSAPSAPSAPVTVSPRARDAASGSVTSLTVSVKNLGVDEEPESPPSRRVSLESVRSESPSERSASPRFARSPSPAPAQPGPALQETPVFAAKAVMIKRERSGEGLPVKRSNSLLSRSIGRDGRLSPTMRREHSWCSDGSSTPNASPIGSPVHAAALAPAKGKNYVRRLYCPTTLSS